MPEKDNFQVSADRGCFVCGCENPGGLQASFCVDSAQGRATSRLQLDNRFQGWQDVVHGGILATLLDEVAIYACRSKGEQQFVTAEINVRYKKPVPVNSYIDLTGQIVEVRRRIYRVASRLEIDGVLHAVAEVRVMRLD
jgi:uncharacterized protein (TIGR00369 family)